MVNNHGDRKSPIPGVVGPLPNSHSWLINLVDGRNSAPVEVGRFCHHLQGFKHAVEGSGFQVGNPYVHYKKYQPPHKNRASFSIPPQKNKLNNQKRGPFVFMARHFFGIFREEKTPSSGDEKPIPYPRESKDQTLPIGSRCRESFKMNHLLKDHSLFGLGLPGVW